ncbi:MAG: hypothetical protein GEV28_22500 [Actinophytocola sp.]|uniref:WXG100 family type VII secretion target n=1 Tax=Actinophytocola sp. TaxID=1872138 RepID=UPI00132057F3|nr:type VII secretion target [Actinophytocola sp.]MPZ83009.1 hypothetical protein [Actinophytocola sp.]
MTPRRRHSSSGSSHHGGDPDPDAGSRHGSNGGSGPARSPGSGDPDAGARSPAGGGPGVEISPDSLDGMAGRLGNTGGRVDAVGSTLDGVDVGPQSMGLVGSGFTGAAQSHVQTARQHVTKTRQAVQQAQDGTSATARTYRDTDTNNAESLGDIDTDGNTPTPRGGESTTPSSATDTGGGGSSTPPPARGGNDGPPPSGGDGGSGGGGGEPPGPARSPDGSDGGWRGDNGLQLTPAQNAAADDFLRRAQQAEPRITSSMQDITSNVPGSHMVGLDYRLKTEDSFKRKLATAIRENPDLSISEHLADMKDSVRYTMQVDQDYSGGVQHAVDTLVDQGYEPVKFKNFWGGEGYQGINSMWRDPQTGQVFEVQFHTQDSFDAKMTTHELYEEARLPDTSPADRDRLNRQQDETFNNVPRPPGAENISPNNRGPRRD